MKNNIYILFIVLLSLGIVSVVNAFESPIYSLDMDVNVEGINVNINFDIEFNITNETEETSSTSNSPGRIIYTNSLSSSSKNKRSSDEAEVFLLNLNNEFSTESRNTINLNYITSSEETASQGSMGTGAIIAGINNFVKSGIGIIILLIFTITGLAVVTVLLKKQNELIPPHKANENC